MDDFPIDYKLIEDNIEIIEKEFISELEENERKEDKDFKEIFKDYKKTLLERNKTLFQPGSIDRSISMLTHEISLDLLIKTNKCNKFKI